VSGRTIASASRAFGNSWQTQPRTILSTTENGTRPGVPRRSTTICCRNTKISASSAARGRNRSKMVSKIIPQRSSIPRRIIRFCHCCQPDGIYDRDRTSVSDNPFWRRASRRRAAGSKTDDASGSLLSRMSIHHRSRQPCGYQLPSSRRRTLKPRARSFATAS
jgi:hypothetical protein